MEYLIAAFLGNLFFFVILPALFTACVALRHLHYMKRIAIAAEKMAPIEISPSEKIDLPPANAEGYRPCPKCGHSLCGQCTLFTNDNGPQGRCHKCRTVMPSSYWAGAKAS